MVVSEIRTKLSSKWGVLLVCSMWRSTSYLIVYLDSSSYGFPCFAYSTTARQGPAAMQPWECNGVISVSGITVRPGDAIVGDQDGVVCVPAKVAEKVYSIAHGREQIEDIVKEELTKNPGPPGKFYPFMSGKIKVDSPLGKLLASKGITPENSNQFEGTADW